MPEINWNNFKAKFNGKESKTFEELCYLLFCQESGQSLGIFRYKNQAGIETEPVQIEDDLVGFQSKFFDGKINQVDVNQSVEKAKDKNPELNKIYLYLNKEFSESSTKGRKKPQNQTEIEDHAKSQGLEIVWRVPSHIEAQLASEENRNLARYYFSLEKSVIDFIGELNNHTLAILKPVQTDIEFNGTKIKIDRSGILSKLKETIDKSSLVILSGVGGVGKTALIKDLSDSIGDDIPLFIFKATEFNINHVNELFNKHGNFTLTDLIDEYENTKSKIVVVDSAEKLSDLRNHEAFQEFLSTLLHHDWIIIFTTRYGYLDDLKFQFVEIYRHGYEVFDVENLKSEELEETSRDFNFTLPKDSRFLVLLKNPFYLNEYLQSYRHLAETASYSDFKNLLWDKQISDSSYRINNTHHKRERCFLSVAKRRADTGVFFVNAEDCEDDILRRLETDEIITHDPSTDGYFITHDIYEEWALDKFIERAFVNSASYKEFFDLLGSSLSIRRAFRSWLSEKLFIDRDNLRHLIEESFVSTEIASFWKDEILVSVLLSDYSVAFFQMFEEVLLEDNQKILMKAIFLLRLSCKEIDENSLKLFGISKKDGNSLKTIFTKPKGQGWSCTIDFLYKHKEGINPSCKPPLFTTSHN